MIDLERQLPQGWTWQPLKHVTTRLSRGTAPDYVDDGPAHAVSQAVNQEYGLDWSRGKFHDYSGDPKNLKGYLEHQDILINSTGTGTLGRIGFFDGSPDGRPCVADGHVTVARTRNDMVDPRFAYYWLGSPSFYDLIYSVLTVGSTNQIELSRERLATAPVPIPNLEEQRRIADFLDVETAKIDRLSCCKTRQIQLLEERELVHIFDAVRGVGFSGRRSHESISWLGDVPDGWPVLPVSSQFTVQLGKMLNQDRVDGDRLRPYLRVLNVQWDYIDVDDLAYMDFPVEERFRYEVRPGDLLICEGGSYPGRAAIWDGRVGEIYYQKALHRARSRGRSLVRWLYYCLRIARSMGVFEADGNASTMTHLTGEQISSRRFPFPDPEIQEGIVRYLDRVISEERQLLSIANCQTSLLNERRQTLITAAVTGQIDVTTARGADVT